MTLEPGSGPADLIAFLNRSYGVFLGWQLGGTSAQDFDRAISELCDVLKRYQLIGWHCTRLTNLEIESITSQGMCLPSLTMLTTRIDSLMNQGLVTERVAARLKSENQAGDENRSNRVWFCFFMPGIAGEGGIGRFFRYWGGEALYSSHERIPDTAAIIGTIGTPCVVEADVPIADLGMITGLAIKVARRFLVHRGLKTQEPVDHEDYIKLPLAAGNIRRVIRFPEDDFLLLTGCKSWDKPIHP